jgi:TPR repeat protein
VQLSEQDQRILIALIWSLKRSDLSVLRACLAEGGEARIATAKGSSNDVFYSKLEGLGLAREAALEVDSVHQPLKNTKTFVLSEQGRAEIGALLEMLLGGGDPPDGSIFTAQAIRMLELNAAQGDAASQRKLGLLYNDGVGVEQSHTEALKWYQKAAESGDPVATNNIGVMHFAGFGVPRDLAEALKWFVAAAKLGSPGAMDNIGEMYSRGLGLTQDKAEALKWFRKAAELGHSAAIQKVQALSAKSS